MRIQVLLNVRDISEMLYTSEANVRKWVKDGKLEVAVFNSKKEGMEFTVEALGEFCRNNPKYLRIFQRSGVAQNLHVSL